MRARALVVAAIAAGALAIAAPAADAGTYASYACSAAGASFGNRGWTAPADPAVVTDARARSRAR